VYLTEIVYVPVDGRETVPAHVVVLKVVPAAEPLRRTCAVVPVAGGLEIVNAYGDGNVVIQDGVGARENAGVGGGVDTPILIIGNALLGHGIQWPLALFCLILYVRKFTAVFVIEKPFAAEITAKYVTTWLVTVKGTGVPFG
jgi:hypothetical protein